MKKTLLAVGLCLLAGLGDPERASAQAVYGSIVGSITDASGAAIPGAKVTITDTGRDVTNVAASNDSGYFTQRFLIVGRYRVRVEAAGFQTFVQDNIGVSVDTETRVDVRMQVGEVTQTLEVSAEASLLKTERSDVASTYSEKTITNLPVLNRRFTNFQLMTPGVVSWPTSMTAASAENPQGSYRILVNGQSFSGTSHLLDGTDNHDAVLGWIVINPNLESVTEAKITTANYDAEFGVASAGVVSAQTKSGTNAIHGSVFEYLRNDHLQARNPFTQSQPIANSNGRMIPVTRWNQFGASVGGPIQKNKLFYFGDYQGTRRLTGGGALLRVPSLAERQGDMSGLGLNVFDPLSSATLAGRTPFANNAIPTSRLSSQALNLMKLIPAPNLNAVRDQPNFAGSGGVKFNDDAFDVRVDHYTTEKMHVFGRYSTQGFNMVAPGNFGAAGGPGLDASGSTNAYAGTSDSRNHSIAAGFDYTVRPNLLTDFRFGYFRYKVFGQPNGIGTSPAKDNGVPGLNVDANFNSGMPAFFINGYGNGLFRFGYALGVNGCNCPLIEDENQYQFVNNWTKLQGNHTFKAGADIRRAHNLRVPSDRHRSGELQFDAARTQGASGGGSGIASFMLGDVSRFERYVSNVLDASETQNRWFFYGQDTWKVTPKLTLNYGLRWEIYRPQTVSGVGKGGYVDLGTGEVLTAGQDGVGLNMNVEGSFTNIAPRFGIAYQLTPKTVIRTGYGRGYNLGIFGSIFGHNVTQNLPVLGIQSLQPANNFDRVFTLAEGPQGLDPATILNGRPKGPNGKPILPNGVTSFIIPKKLRLPTVDAVNFTIQHQINNTLYVEAGYVGTKGTHVFAGNGGDYDPNQATIVGYPTLTTNQRKPFFQKFGWSQNFRYYASDASNNYHSLQLKAEKRFSHGYSLITHYTWSKNMDYTGTYYPQDARLAYGQSDFNRNHVFFLGSLYEVPIGKGRKFLSSASRLTDLLIGGWQLNTTFSRQAGQPLTPSYRDCGGDRDTGWCRPDVAGDIFASSPSQFGWFNTADTPLVANGQVTGAWRRPQRGQFGNIGRNRVIGPAFSQWDMSFFKTFTVTEKVKTQFRAESFNFANKVNFGQPNGCVDCPGVAGRIFGTFANYVPRQWQMALKVEF
ncbi:MAG: TonB-dependent receptor [Candidatus Solibacter usitatus]|nr:TonB-dependent receptor [Candidatus Solibacter usitatus]